MIETHLFIFKIPEGQTVSSKKFYFKQIPDSIMPDSEIQKEGVKIANTELSMIVFNLSQELGRDILPHILPIRTRTLFSIRGFELVDFQKAYRRA
jgi:hypothetical protein